MFAWHDTPWMWLSMVAFWSLFAVFAYYAMTGVTRRTAARSGPRATELLEQRYARGEISAEEYRERRETLEPRGAPRGEE
jgi:putative membrane protein